jgi:hypothetical protein
VQLDDSQNLGVDLRAAGRWLPVVRRTDAPVRNDITGVVSTILWNYLEFLVETRS